MLHYIAILTATIGITTAETPEPQWQSDYATALKQTRSDDRPLLMVIDQPGVTESSVAADVLASNADGALADYDLCHVDASTSYGKKVAQAFKANALPYVAFIDKSGSVILHSETGTLSTESWNTLVTKYRTGTKPVKRVVAKPVVTTTPVSNAQPYYPQAKPYCAKCQRGY